MSDMATTPGRITSADFDLTESVLGEPAWSRTRVGSEVAKPSQNGLVAGDDVIFRASGCWTLKPIQAEIGNLAELETYQALIVGPGQLHDMNLIATIAQVNAWRASSELPGIEYDTLVAKTGDPWLVKRVPAAGKWDEIIESAVPVPPVYTKYGVPVTMPPGPETVLIPVDRVGESKEVFPNNQGFFLRWTTPGTGRSHPGVVWNFYFGQYALVLRGNGKAALWEYCLDANGDFQWRVRAEFRYARPSQIGDASHTLLIWPHKDTNGERYISFSGGQLDAAGYINGAAKTDSQHVAPTEYVYKVDPLARGTDVDMSPGEVTASDLCRFDMRRDLRVQVQISVIGWALQGNLVDIPDALPPFTSDAEPVTISLDTREPDGTSITAQIFDADTGELFVAGRHTKPYVQFTFTGDGTSTPELWGYTLHRNPVVTVSAPGSFTASGLDTLCGINIVGYDGDPSHQSGLLHIEDVTGAYPRLQNRGLFSVRVHTTYTPADTLERDITLLRGYAERPDGTLFGKQGDVYPSPDWYSWEIPLLGMWRRLAERVEDPYLRYFRDDSGDPPMGHNVPKPAGSTALIPWKVTDAIRALISACGFFDSQINIPDLPYRLYPGRFNKQADDTINPGANYAEIIQKWARNYLGGYLIYDENTVGDGQWTLLFAPPIGSTPTPVWNFVTSAQTPYFPPHLPQGYAPNTSPILIPPRLHVKPIAPEKNFIYVLCPVNLGDAKTRAGICNWAWNPKSFNMPGLPPTADPEHPDYVGRCLPTVIIDPSLAGVGNATKNAYEMTQQAVDFTVRRLYDFTCHGQKILYFTAPLVFIPDPKNAGRYRPLRFLDPITVNGDNYLLRSSPVIQYDSTTTGNHQMATYEAIKPVTL